jgi:Flp pilus assembly pilin Flp
MQVGISRVHAIFKKIGLTDRGQSMTEYALICALVAFGATAGYHGVADGIASAYNTISTDFSGAFGSTNGNTYGGGKSAGSDGTGFAPAAHGGKAAGGQGGKNPPHGKGH